MKNSGRPAGRPAGQLASRSAGQPAGFRQAFIQSFIQGTLVMKIFRRRKVQLEKRPKSGYFFVFRLKNRRAEELRSENGCFGTEIVDFPIGFGGPEARKRPKT